MVSKQRLKKIALRIGIPLTLYITTKDWGFDVKEFDHKEDQKFTDIYNTEKADFAFDKYKGGSNIEGAVFGRDSKLNELTTVITKFPYNKETLEEKTTYFNNLLGDRHLTLGDVDSGRYIFTVRDKTGKAKFARVLDVEKGKDYFLDVELKSGLKSIVQKFYTGLTKLRYNVANYLVKKRYAES